MSALDDLIPPVWDETLAIPYHSWKTARAELAAYKLLAQATADPSGRIDLNSDEPAGMLGPFATRARKFFEVRLGGKHADFLIIYEDGSVWRITEPEPEPQYIRRRPGIGSQEWNR